MIYEKFKQYDDTIDVTTVDEKCRKLNSIEDLKSLQPWKGFYLALANFGHIAVMGRAFEGKVTKIIVLTQGKPQNLSVTLPRAYRY